MLENVSNEVLHAEIKKRLQKKVGETSNGVEQLIDASLYLSRQLGEARGFATALRNEFCEELKLPWE